MTGWHALDPIDRAFFTTAPQRYRLRANLPVPVTQVWAALVSEESISAWPADPGFALRAHWSSARPFGVGTTREVRVPTGLVLREHFFRWEEGTGHSFYVTETNRRGLTHFAEDYEIAPTATGCALTWTVALQASSAVQRLVGPAVLFNRLSLAGTMHALKRFFR